MFSAPLTVYTGSGFKEWELGDISVIEHEGTFHLFHLIIPNHDYIAHAISNDGLTWKRVQNAIFVGDPGDWDDDMLWTMHVYFTGENFEMYYTGLQSRERGVISRIGLAVSDDLYTWKKVRNEVFPFGSKAPYYESLENNPRKWLSFRDPFRFDHQEKKYFLICARTAAGPVSRRGCIGLYEWDNDGAKPLPPLHFPHVYDDVECPCAFELNGRFYLLGSIREDIKVRYWFAPDFLGEYHSFHVNVLLPQGNYAARVQRYKEHLLIFAFFYTYGKIDSLRVMLPPKQLDTDDRGRLILRSYYLWNELVRDEISQQNFHPTEFIFRNETAYVFEEDDKILMESRSGYELFCWQKPYDNYIWEGIIAAEGLGKIGLVTDIDGDGNGYYYSIDVVQGNLKLRTWGFNPDDNKTNFTYITLQESIFEIDPDHTYRFRLIRYGNYIEFEINGVVRLTLMDSLYNGNPLMGILSASSLVSLKDSVIKSLPDAPYEHSIK